MDSSESDDDTPAGDGNTLLSLAAKSLPQEPNIESGENHTDVGKIKDTWDSTSEPIASSIENATKKSTGDKMGTLVGTNDSIDSNDDLEDSEPKNTRQKTVSEENPTKVDDQQKKKTFSTYLLKFIRPLNEYELTVCLKYLNEYNDMCNALYYSDSKKSSSIPAAETPKRDSDNTQSNAVATQAEETKQHGKKEKRISVASRFLESDVSNVDKIGNENVNCSSNSESRNEPPLPSISPNANSNVVKRKYSNTKNESDKRLKATAKEFVPQASAQNSRDLPTEFNFKTSGCSGLFIPKKSRKKIETPVKSKSPKVLNEADKKRDVDKIGNENVNCSSNSESRNEPPLPSISPNANSNAVKRKSSNTKNESDKRLKTTAAEFIPRASAQNSSDLPIEFNFKTYGCSGLFIPKKSRKKIETSVKLKSPKVLNEADKKRDISTEEYAPGLSKRNSQEPCSENIRPKREVHSAGISGHIFILNKSRNSTETPIKLKSPKLLNESNKKRKISTEEYAPGLSKRNSQDPCTESFIPKPEEYTVGTSYHIFKKSKNKQHIRSGSASRYSWYSQSYRTLTDPVDHELFRQSPDTVTQNQKNNFVNHHLDKSINSDTNLETCSSVETSPTSHKSSFRSHVTIPKTSELIFHPRRGTEVCLLRCRWQNVGNGFINSEFPTFVLQWNPSWIQTQRQTSKVAPICSFSPVVMYAYENELEFYNTYVSLLFLDIWMKIYEAEQQTTAFTVDFLGQEIEQYYTTISCSVVLNETQVCPKREDIILCSFKNGEDGYEDMFGRVISVKSKSQSGNFKKIKFDFHCVEPLKFIASNKVKVQILLNIRLAVLQNKSLLSLNDGMKYLILEPLGHGDNIDILRYMPDSDVGSTRDKIISFISKWQTQVVLVETPYPCDTLVLISLLAISLKKNGSLVIICLKNVQSFHKLVKILIPYYPVLAVKTEELDLPDGFVRYTLEERLNNMETVRDIFKSCPLMLTLFSAFSFRECRYEFLKWNVVCIVDDAYLCTEAETTLPFMYNVDKVIMLGKPDHGADVPPYLKNFRYNVSLFDRIYKSKKYDQMRKAFIKC